MFEVAELGRKVPKKVYAKEEPKIHTALLDVQREVAKAKFPVIVIVSGVEAAGKGDVVSLLNRWLDTRGLRTHAFWDETDEEAQRPRYWKFWRALPPAGTMAILFGSWYTAPIINRVFRRSSADEFEHELARIREFERLLAADGALIVKLWFHLPQKEQRARLAAEAKAGKLGSGVSPIVKKFSKRYDQFIEVSATAIQSTDSGASPWHLIEATDQRYRDLTVGRILLESIRRRLDEPSVPAAELESATPGSSASVSAEPVASEAAITILDRVDLKKSLSRGEYDRRLAKFQRKLFDLAWKARDQKLFTVALFEGWDASGKGGAIRRVTQAVDARLFQVISVAAPSDEERAQHYLWRFWRQLPRSGYMTLYDRSWYGRVLVERVEGLARQVEWRRAYAEINDFEEQLVDHGIILMKFWLHISPEEQLARFREREKTPWKQHKITEEDWRNRDKWEAYKEAVNDMLARTSTTYAPWTVVAANNKHWARVDVLKTFCKRIQEALA